MYFFPRHWDRRKVSEVRVAIYLAIVASMFWVWPGALSAPVYDPFRDVMPAEGWAGIMMIVCLLHMFAVFMNGRVPAMSTGVRLAACTLHLGMALTFAGLFAVSGAYWGTITYVVIVAWPLIGSLGYTIEQVRELWTFSEF
ncbi:MAG: hypothetical protein AAGI03_00530 [Pseudomonadota bacterium]